jgi:hypothetical protein
MNNHQKMLYNIVLKLELSKQDIKYSYSGLPENLKAVERRRRTIENSLSPSSLGS